MEPFPVDDAWLVEQYVEKQRGGPEIAREIGCTPTTVWRRLRAQGVEIRPKAAAMQLARAGRIRTKEVELRAVDLYKAGYSGNEIARALRLGKTDVFSILERHGVPRRTKKEASKSRRNPAQRSRPKASELRGVLSECGICGTKRNLEIHHINGASDDNSPGNLMALCWEHHVFVEYLIGQAIMGFRRRYLASG